MSENKSHFEVEKGSERGFGLVFAVVFLIIGLVPYFNSGKLHIWVFIVSAVFAVLAFVAPKLLKPLNHLWFKFGMLLGAIIAPLVMMIIFFLVVTPIGLLMRLFGKDPLRLKRDATSNTYWINREPNEDHQSMKNQF